ncbi:MAG: S9 family peptidase [Chloroflexi bacterium]|nr:MAG: S9 family peptidase [Chloroflexota bacterium]
MSKTRNAPSAPKRRHEMTQHGVTRIDDYYWMRDRNDPETMKYLRAESDYLEEVMGHTKPLQERLFSEMKGRIQETDSTVPEKRGDYFHYERHEEGKQYPIFCRRYKSLDADEEILLDQNQLAEGKAFCGISGFETSPDGTKLAYVADFEGSEVFTLYIKDLLSGEYFPETIGNVSGSAYEHFGVEWANDNKTIFYITLDETLRPDKLFRHIIGTDPKDDMMILHEADETFHLYVHRTRDRALIMTYHYSTDTREIRFLDANDPTGGFRILQPRIEGLDYNAAHHKGRFFIVHNDGAKNFKVSVTSAVAPNKENWKEIIPHREDVLVDYLDTFENHLVVYERKGGLRQIRISDADGISNVRYVKFPEPSYNAHPEGNPEFKTNLLRLKYSSLITPNTTVDVHMDTGEWEIKKVDEVRGFDKTNYQLERIHAIAADGTKVPVTIAYRKDLQKKDGANPALMYGYGSYGATIDPYFDSNRFSLIDRGFVYAVTHIRGGYDMGRDWYEQGRMEHKRKTFTDFIACAEHLIQEGYVAKDKLAIQGASAGGLLVGACMTMRPDLFKAVIAKVPFVDVVTTMNDPSIPLTTQEYDQWGNPEDKKMFEYMLSYSPYDNLTATDYPNLLITTGLNDPRVAFWEPAKFMAKLRELKTDDNLAVFYVNYNSGHAGASGRFDYIREIALDYAFLLDRFNLERPKKPD